MCDRIYVLYAGSLLEAGRAAEVEAEPLHPYSHGLLLSEPPADRRVRDLVSIPGSVPSPDAVARSCAFAPRCRWVDPACEQAAPPLAEVAPGRWSACIRLPGIRAERGIGYLFITHDLSIVRQITDHLYVMHHGRIAEYGPTETVLANPRDPYTIKLLEAAPRPGPDWLTEREPGAVEPSAGRT